MGIRGKLPTIRTVASEQLTTLDPPNWLGSDARQYWTKHAEWLVANNLLTSATEESFATHCDLWQRLVDMRGAPTTRAFLDCHKAFGTSCKQFRLIPCDKPGEVVTGRFDNAKKLKWDNKE